MPGELIIQFRDGTTAEDRAEVRALIGATRRELLRRGRNRAGDLEVAQVADRRIERIIERLRRHPAVEVAEPNWILHATTTSNDTLYVNGNHWGMYSATSNPANQFGSAAADAWAEGHTGSASVAVGVLDEGIQITHPELAANIWTNPVEAAGVAGVDDDGNGYIDDIHGWDFFSNDNSVYDGTVDDHGTHVAGTIGAVGGNGTGVAGVNWQVTMVPAKFLGPAGGSTGATIKAIDYLIDLKTRHGLNIVAINNSWGGGGFSQTQLNAIVRAAKANIVFVVAAGNAGSDNDATPAYPSNYSTVAGAGFEDVISVANMTSTGAKAASSSYGATTVDLGAPGSHIISTYPTNTYSFLDGTSMATPHVTGAAALYASLLPHVSARRIRDVILAAAVATPTPSLSGKTVTGGRLNIGLFAGAAPPAPKVPLSLNASPASPTQIALTWVDDSSNEDGFMIERCEGDTCNNFAQVAWADEAATSYADTGRTPSTLYRYRIRAFNRGGNSAFSNQAEAMTLDPPSVTADAGADISINEGEPVTLDGSASTSPDPNPAFAWTQTSGPPVSLTGADTDHASFTAPMVGAAGALLTFDLTVSNGASSDTDTVHVTVINVNAPPLISSTAPSTATEDVLYSYSATANDEDGPDQSWELLPGHTCGGAIALTSGLFTFTPAGPVPPPSCVLSIQVCDGADPDGCASETATVTITPVNDAPQITSNAPTTATEDVPYFYSATVVDEDGPGATWSLLPANSCGGAIDAAGVYSFTPVGPTPDPSCVVALQVCDNGAPNACAQESAIVMITSVNDPPAITGTPGAATEDVLFTYAAIASDPDGPAATWSLLPPHTCGGTLSAAGVFSFTPAGPVPPASCQLALMVCDGGTPEACAAQASVIAIAAVNDAPSITVPGDISAVASGASGVAVSFVTSGSDPEDGVLIPTCSNPSGSIFPIGATTVTCSVTDGGGASAVGAFKVVVSDPSTPGEMRGDGFVRDDSARYQFNFWARERASGSERARLSIRIDEQGRGKKGKKRDDRFESRSVDFMQFSDDPAIRPGRKNRPPIDTVLFSGEGEWNGRRGYFYEVFAQDAGEPGRHRESIHVTIRDAHGVTVADFAGDLDGGNIQSSRIRH